jgi:hypothetical protein
MTSKSLRVSSASYRMPDTTSVRPIAISMTFGDGCTPQPLPCHPLHHTLHILLNLYHVLHMLFQPNPLREEPLLRPRHDPNMCDYEPVHQHYRLPNNPTALPEVKLLHQHPCGPPPLRRLGFTSDSPLIRPYILSPATRTRLLRLLNDLLVFQELANPMPSRY